MKRGITIIGIGVIAGALIAVGYHAQKDQDEPQRVARATSAVHSDDAGTSDAWLPAIADPEPVAEVAEAGEQAAMQPAAEPVADAALAPSPAAAVPTTDDAAREGPQDPMALVQSARKLLDGGDARAAEAKALEATGLEPRCAAAWHMLGRAQLARGAAVEAEASFRHAFELDPTNAFAANNLGYVLLLRGDWQAAREPLESAVALRDDVAYFHNNLGVVYEHLGLWNLAAQAYGRAVELDPDHSRARVSLARAQAHLDPDARQLARSDTDSSDATARFLEP